MTSGLNLTVQNIDHIALVVRDRQASKEWYRANFGLESLDGDPNSNSPYVGNDTIKLAILQAADPESFVPPVNQGSRACHFAFGTDLDTFKTCESKLDESGTEYEKLIHADCQSIYFSDPNGYLIEVTTYEFD